MGTPQFAVPSLEAMLSHGRNVIAVVTQPDRRKGRGRKLAPPPVKEAALREKIPVLQPDTIKSAAFLSEIENLKPDIIVVTAYGKILPGPLLSLPRYGTINVHGSLLPQYRGAAPIQWALINGEAETGVTIMQMDEGMDTGDILLPRAIPIAPEDTAGSLAEKLSVLGGELLVEALDLLTEDKLVSRKQDDAAATYAPLLSKKDGRIDWKKPASTISCLIRGLDPWPSAYTTLDGKWMRLFVPEVRDGEVSDAPGTIVRAGTEGLLIATSKGSLLVKEIQREGGRRMDVESFLRGRPFAEGSQLD